MAQKISPFSKIVITTCIALFCILFPIFFPLPRQIGLTIRYDLIFLVCGFGIGLYLLWFKKSAPWQILSFGFITLMFILSVTGLWTSGQSEVYALNGLLPWNDGNTYFSDTLRMIASGMMDSFSARRPLAPLFYSLIMYFTGQNIQAFQIVLAIISAFSCYLAGREIQRTFNTLTAVIFTLILFLFSRRFTGIFLTENLGIPLGLMAFTLMWRAFQTQHFPSALCGLFTLTLALNVRAGAFLVIFTVFIYLSWYFCNHFKNIYKNGLLILMILLGFGTNWLTYKLTSPADGMLFSNFADTLYGTVVGGKGWQQIGTDHPEVNQLAQDVRASAIYGLAWQAFTNNPGQLIVGAVKYWSDFFSTSDNSVFAFINGEHINETKLSTTLGCLTLYLFSLFGLFYLWRNRRDARSIFILLGWVGILLSVPFVPPPDADRMRAYAATLPFVALLPAIGINVVFELITQKRVNTLPEIITSGKWATLPMVSNLILLFFVCVAGWYLKIQAGPAAQVNYTCNPGEQPIVFQFSKGSYIHVSKNESNVVNWFPNLSQSRFIIGVHGTSLAYSKEIEQISPPFILTTGINLINTKPFYLVIPDDVSGVKEGILRVCAKPSDSALLRSNDFYDVKSVVQ